MNRTVRIHYRRLPDRVQVFEQEVVEDAGAYIVTFHPAAAIPKPVRVGEQIVLEPGSPVVWLTYPGKSYDAGRFHRADGTFTGVYANLLTPVQIEGDRWETTDLCLDVWAGADRTVETLDENEFEEAVEQGWIDPATATSARAQADALSAAARRGTRPPEHIQAWTLERVLAHLHRTP